MQFPEQIRTMAEPVLTAVDVTTVMAATVVLSVVAMIRRLSYGVAAVLTLTVGANLGSALVRVWADGAPEAILPSGHVVAAMAVYSTGLLVASPRFKPVVSGLGAVVVLAVVAASLASEPVGLPGIAAAGTITAIWWAVASIIMVYSPIAAERERQRPDPAAMALVRHR
nr:hypothetical protein [Rhodococcus sp. HNM0569]